MSLAGNIYRELTGYDDPDSYAPPLIVCLDCSAFPYSLGTSPARPWLHDTRLSGLSLVLILI